MPEERPLPPQRQLPEPHEMQLPMSHYQLLRKPTFFEHYPWSKWLIVFIAIILMSFFSILYVQMAMLQANLPAEQEPTPIITSTPTPAMEWQTYINDKQSYSIAYPPSWFVFPDEFGGTISGFDGTVISSTKSFEEHGEILADAGQTGIAISIIGTDKKANETLAAYVKKKYSSPDGENETYQETFIGSIPAIKSTQGNTVRTKGLTNYYIQNNTFIYGINVSIQNENHKELVNKILSSFSFLDKSISDGKFCGGIAGVQCPNGYQCKLDGNYPDAGGTCIENP